MVVWYSVGMDSANIIKWLQEAITAVQSDDPVTALGAISHAQCLLEDAAGSAFDDEPADIDGDDYYDDYHDPYGGGSMMIGGDSDLMNEC